MALPTMTAAILFSGLASGNGQLDVQPFPAAKEGMTQFVIELSPKVRGEDELFRVELIPGKTMKTDGVNRVRLATRLEPRFLQGWGYTYYEVTGKDLTMSTMIAAPEGTSTVEEFVTGASLFIPYNSRLPIVIYGPSDYEIRYRIWQGEGHTGVAEKKITVDQPSF